jgi:uncharacterized protein YjbI with pentapeptide repeats
MKEDTMITLTTLDSSTARRRIQNDAIVDSVILPDGFVWPSLEGFRGTHISSQHMSVRKPLLGSRSWTDCSLQDCNIDGFTWTGLQASNCEFISTNCGHKWLALGEKCNLEKVTFRSCEFIGTIFKNVSFENVVFDQCLLKRVIFRDCKFDHCNFSGKLAIVNFINCAIKQCDFRDAFCGGVSLPYSTIEGTLFPDHERNFWISSGALRDASSAAIQLASESSQEAVISFFENYTQRPNGVLLDDSHLQDVPAKDRRKIMEYLHAHR